MMMTAAGTVPAARVFVMGVGVAGFRPSPQRAASAPSSPRPTCARRSRSRSPRSAPSSSRSRTRNSSRPRPPAGYAKEMSDEYKKKQAALVAEHVKNQDIVITTALIPGRPAPKLISKAMIESMRPAQSSSISRSSAAAMPSSPSQERSSSTTACPSWASSTCPVRAGQCLEPLCAQSVRLRRSADRKKSGEAASMGRRLVKGTLIAQGRRHRATP